MNYYAKRGDWPVCHRSWCGNCYPLIDDGDFHINRLNYLASGEEDDPEEQMRLEDGWAGKHKDKDDYLKARNGDHLHVPFECDTCVFIKLKNALPDPSSHVDLLLLKCIRRVILDSFWSRTTPTGGGYVRLANTQLKLSTSLGLEGPFVHRGPMSMHDHCGYEVAVAMVLYSTRPGRNDKRYTQFDTIRKLRSIYSNFTRASTQSSRSNLALSDLHKRYVKLVPDECASFWFK